MGDVIIGLAGEGSDRQKLSAGRRGTDSEDKNVNSSRPEVSIMQAEEEPK